MELLLWTHARPLHEQQETFVPHLLLYRGMYEGRYGCWSNLKGGDIRRRETGGNGIDYEAIFAIARICRAW